MQSLIIQNHQRQQKKNENPEIHQHPTDKISSFTKKPILKQWMTQWHLNNSYFINLPHHHHAIIHHNSIINSTTTNIFIRLQQELLNNLYSYGGIITIDFSEKLSKASDISFGTSRASSAVPSYGGYSAIL